MDKIVILVLQEESILLFPLRPNRLDLISYEFRFHS